MVVRSTRCADWTRSHPVAATAWPDFGNWEGAEVFVFPYFGWVNALLPVQGVDPVGHALLVSSGQDIRPGNRFFI